jgi:hypothetical protein
MKQAEGYSPEERAQIAAGIREYMQHGKIHTVIKQPDWMPVDKNKPDPLVESIRTASTADLQWLELVARDVEGLIDHES